MGRRTGWAAVVGTVAATAMLCAPAMAHIERTAYWPDPRPDDSATPAAGGAVPKPRSLESALDASAPGTTRVVCQSDSLARAERDIATARDKGFRLRPSQKPRKLSA